MAGSFKFKGGFTGFVEGSFKGSYKVPSDPESQASEA